MKNLHSLQSFTLHRIVFHGNQSLLKLRDFEINYLLFFLEFYFTNLSLVDTSLVYFIFTRPQNIPCTRDDRLWCISPLLWRESSRWSWSWRSEPGGEPHTPGPGMRYETTGQKCSVLSIGYVVHGRLKPLSQRQDLSKGKRKQI